MANGKARRERKNHFTVHLQVNMSVSSFLNWPGHFPFYQHSIYRLTASPHISRCRLIRWQHLPGYWCCMSLWIHWNYRLDGCLFHLSSHKESLILIMPSPHTTTYNNVASLEVCWSFVDFRKSSRPCPFLWEMSVFANWSSDLTSCSPMCFLLHSSVGPPQ